MSLLRRTIRETTLFDWLLFLLLLFFSLSGFVFVKRLIPSGERILIEVDGRPVYRLSLNEDRIVDVKGTIGVTKVEIKDHRVRVSEAPCPLKICIKQGWTEKGAIICLPNRVVITIEGGEKGGGLDGITG